MLKASHSVRSRISSTRPPPAAICSRIRWARGRWKTSTFTPGFFRKRCTRFLRASRLASRGERATTCPTWRLRLRKTPMATVARLTPWFLVPGADPKEAVRSDWQRASPVFQSWMPPVLRSVCGRYASGLPTRRQPAFAKPPMPGVPYSGGATLYFANLSHAYLNYTNLSDARLNLADLSGADLTEADLRGAHAIMTGLRN